jgi:hypothetical protein
MTIRSFGTLGLMGTVVAVKISQSVTNLAENMSCKCLNFPLVYEYRPPLWPSGQSSWLQIRRPRFDSRQYQKKKVVGLERGPLSLVSTTEELLDRKVAAPV